jgi:hypothetical protein
MIRITAADKEEEEAARVLQRAWRRRATRGHARAYRAAAARMQGHTYAETLHVAREVGEAMGVGVRRLWALYDPHPQQAPTEVATRVVASAHTIAHHHELLFGPTMRLLAPERCEAVRAAAERVLACLDRVCHALLVERRPLRALAAGLPRALVAFLEAFKAWHTLDTRRIYLSLTRMLGHMRASEAPLLHPQAQRPTLEAQVAMLRQRIVEIKGERALEAHDAERWHLRAFRGRPLPLDAIDDERLLHEMRVAPHFATALCDNEAYRTRAYWDALADDLRWPHLRGTARLDAALALVRPALPRGSLPMWPYVPPPRDAMDALRRAYVAFNRLAPLHQVEREAWQALAARYRAPLASDAFAAWFADGLEMLAHRAAHLRARIIARRTARCAPRPPTTSTSTAAPERVLDLLLSSPQRDAEKREGFDRDRLRELRLEIDTLAADAGRDTVVAALRLLEQTRAEEPAVPLRPGALVTRLRGLWQRIACLEAARRTPPPPHDPRYDRFLDA